jgi:hemolysin activation/secretion protein
MYSLISRTLVLALFLLVTPQLVQAQARQRPADEKPELEEFEPEEEVRPRVDLPELEPPPDEPRPSAGLRVFVRGFRFEGSTVFETEELEELTRPWAGRTISSEELLEARDAVTGHYIDHGYITSGALIPDQPLEDGVIVLQVIEGRLGDVEVRGTKGFRPSYFQGRMRIAGRTPVRLHEIEQELRRLQREPAIQRIQAELVPGPRRGESVLLLDVVEERRFALSSMFGNPESPRIGDRGGWARTSYTNLVGVGDVLSAETGWTEGLWNLDLRYRAPITTRDTELRLRFYRSSSEVVEGPFDDLDIESESVEYGIGLRHPVYRSPSQSLWLGVMGQYRKSKSYLLGERFSFGPGPENGKAVVSVLRFVQDWTLRGRRNVVAARSTLSWGTGLLGATTHSDSDSPDGRFLVWLGQFQWGHRLPEQYWSSQLITRFDAQLTTDRLLSLEKFDVGGLRTVRGYQENQFVRDNGLVGSIELRIPVLETDRGLPLLEVAPFFDIGRSWQKGGEFESIRTISSLGLGLLSRPTQRVFAEVYWGGRLRKGVSRTGNSVQNQGFHVRLTVTAF